MKTFVLIMIISVWDDGITTTTVEFDSVENCKSAAMAIQNRLHQSNDIRVEAWGCYEK